MLNSQRVIYIYMYYNITNMGIIDDNNGIFMGVVKTNWMVDYGFLKHYL